MSLETRRRALETVGSAHPNPEAVTAAPFCSGEPFFLMLDKVQV